MTFSLTDGNHFMENLLTNNKTYHSLVIRTFDSSVCLLELIEREIDHPASAHKHRGLGTPSAPSMWTAGSPPLEPALAVSQGVH